MVSFGVAEGIGFTAARAKKSARRLPYSEVRFMKSPDPILLSRSHRASLDPMSNRPACPGRNLVSELYALVSLVGLAGYLVAALAL